MKNNIKHGKASKKRVSELIERVKNNKNASIGMIVTINNGVSVAEYEMLVDAFNDLMDECVRLQQKLARIQEVIKE